MDNAIIKQDSKKSLIYGIAAAASLLLVLSVVYLFTGKWPWDENIYNTYALQADSWRQGRLDLGQNYTWLELAVYNGKYYCSFPPFPSFILFPYTFIFGSRTPDGLILLGINILTVIYLYRIALAFRIKQESAVLQALFVFVGSNALFNTFDPSVWFFAQNLCFLLAVLAFYYAEVGKGGASLFFWACSVGCRPMQIVFLPVILFILLEREKTSINRSFVAIIKSRWRWLLPMGAVACSYMLLNYFRFGSIAEFGRKYLPEFTEGDYSQFNIGYVADNLRSLFALPEINDQGRMILNHFGALSVIIVSPIVLYFLGVLLYHGVWREVQAKERLRFCLIPVLVLMCSVGYMIIVLFHKTMGGWQFGNRYANDILPWIYGAVCCMVYKHPYLIKADTLVSFRAVHQYNRNDSGNERLVKADVWKG